LRKGEEKNKERLALFANKTTVNKLFLLESCLRALLVKVEMKDGKVLNIGNFYGLCDENKRRNYLLDWNLKDREGLILYKGDFNMVLEENQKSVPKKVKVSGQLLWG
jgi:hypothetical protein